MNIFSDAFNELDNLIEENKVEPKINKCVDDNYKTSSTVGNFDTLYLGEGLKNRQRKIVENAANDSMRIYMNTWANYNENGADLSKYGINSISDGWLSIDDAIAFRDKYAEDEPFINDTDNVPFEIGENDTDELETLKEIEDSKIDFDIVSAIQQCRGGDLKDCIRIAIDGDYHFIPDVSTDSELGYAVVDEFDGIQNAVSNPSYYIDREAMIRDYEDDCRESLRDSAKDNIDNYDELTPEEQEAAVENYIDENIEDYVEEVVDEEIRMAESGDIDLTNYFDYEAFGRDLRLGGDYCIVNSGAINVYN